MTKITWTNFVKLVVGGNGWTNFANGWPKDASKVVLSRDVAYYPNYTPVGYFWVGWDDNKDGYTRRVRIFKSHRQASKFARIMCKKMGAKFKSMLH